MVLLFLVSHLMCSRAEKAQDTPAPATAPPPRPPVEEAAPAKPIPEPARIDTALTFEKAYRVYHNDDLTDLQKEALWEREFSGKCVRWNRRPGQRERADLRQRFQREHAAPD